MKKQNILVKNCANQQGFTLVEFMVASVLGLVVIAGAGALYSYTKRLNDVGMARVAMLQDLRAAATMIGQDARSAGVFGCATLGRRNAPDTPKGWIGVNNDVVVEPFKTLSGKPQEPLTLDSATPAAGVRWIKASDATSLTGIWNSSFTPQSGVLLFYYGEGGLLFQSAAGDNVTFNTTGGHPNKIVEGVFESGGYVVAAGCNVLQFKKVAAGASNAHIVDVSAAVANAPTPDTSGGLPDGVTAAMGHADMILQRYKVVAYVVGKITGEDDDREGSLYRFEFGANGDNWSAPQQLAKNVKAMTAEYLFVTECPSGAITSSGGAIISGGGASAGSGGSTLANINDQKFTVQDAASGDALLDKPIGAYQGPSSVRLTLTYDFPTIRGGSVATGGTDQEFVITSTVRGGNVCASRKILEM